MKHNPDPLDNTPLSIGSKPRWFTSWPVVVALLCAHYALGITSVLNKSCSCDEIAYLTSGYTYWQTGDYRLVPEHPPVIELWGSLPLNFMSLKMPTLDQDCWRESDQWRFGWQFFYELGNPLEKMLLAGRAMIGLFSVALGLTIYLVSRRWFGPVGGLISLTIFAFAPETLAHGFQVTTDMAATLFFLLSLLSVWWALQRVTPASVFLSGLALAALFNSKMSAVLMFPIYGILVAIRCYLSAPLQIDLRRVWEIRPRLRRLAAHAAVFFAQVLIVAAGTWALHGMKYKALVHSTPGVDHFLTTNPDPESRVSDWDYELYRFGKLAPVVRFAREHRLLPEAYLYGFLYAMNMTKGSDAFLNGDRSQQGFKAYFPYAFLFKTTLPAIVLLLLAAGIWALMFNKRHRDGPTLGARSPPIIVRAIPLIVFFVIYWITAILSPFNIGHRHILPIYPPLMIFAGILGTYSVRRVPVRAAVILLLALHAAACLRAWPHYLAFFNSIGGGSKNGYRHFVDSSVDWGQDLKGLADWLKEHNPPFSSNTVPVYLSYLGNGSPTYYGMKPRYLPSNSWWQTEQESTLQPGLYCISATMLQQVYMLPLTNWSKTLEWLFQLCRPRIELLQRSMPFSTTLPDEDQNERIPEYYVLKLRFGRLCAYLREREPLASIGHSIMIYRVSREDLERAQNGPPPLLGPDTAEALWHMADALALEGLVTIPAAIYRESFKLSPADAIIHNNLGIVLSRSGKIAEAAEEFRAAIELDPDYSRAHNNLGAMLEKLGRVDEAMHHHVEAVRLQPDWPEAQANLAGVYSRKNDLVRAIEHWRIALRLHPEWPEMHNFLGIALARSGRYEDAIASFTESLRQKPDSAAAHINMGNALRSLGRSAEAEQEYQAALRINPNDKVAAQRLAELTTSRPAASNPSTGAIPRE